MSPIERLKAEVASRRQRCRDAWHIEGDHPTHIFFAAHNFHREVQELRECEARLQELEAATAEKGAA